MAAYYNEHDRQKAAWLRELIRRGLVADGEVDERSIEDVRPSDLAGFSQHHFFAGIGIWSYALRQAGYPDSRPVWTGSCPCQPFSTAGKGDGFADERHLWPAWFHLIEQSKPDVVFGEQVASKDGYSWLDLVQTDMEALGYAFGPLVLPAAGLGAPEGRHRIFFVADAEYDGRNSAHRFTAVESSDGQGVGVSERDCSVSALGVTATGRRRTGRRRTGRSGQPLPVEEPCGTIERSKSIGDVDNAIITGLEGHAGNGDGRDEPGRQREAASGPTCRVGNPEGVGRVGRAHDGNVGRRERASGQAGEAGSVADADLNESGDGELQRSRGFLQSEENPLAGFWGDAEWIHCAPEKKYPEGRWRPVEPGTFPLVNGAPARVVRLRGYGDGIVAPVATAFIEAFIDIKENT